MKRALRSPLSGLNSLGNGRPSGVDAFVTTFVGLSTDSIGSYGQVGNHAAISYTITPDNGTETVKWSASSNPADAATFGTGANPTTFAIADGFSVYLHTTDGATTITRSFPARYAPGSASAIADGQTWTVDDTAVNLNAAASGSNLTFSYAASGLPLGVSINSGTGAITGTPTIVSSGTVTVTATDQYGRTYVDSFTFTSSLRAQATAANGLGPFSWTVDDTAINVSFVPDFTTNGNTLSYVITGRSSGVNDDGDGTISGTPTTAGSGTLTCTATDQYGRITTSSANFTSAFRSQATGGTNLDLSFEEDSSITPVDLIQNWTDNGNTLVFLSVSPTLPSGLSINSSGVLSGTPTTITADATYTLTMEDEYGRETSDSFTLEIIEVDLAPTITSIEVGVEDGGEIPVTITGLSENSTAFYVLVPSGDPPPSAAQILAGDDSSDSPAPDSGSFSAVVEGGPELVEIGTGLFGDYDLYVVFQDTKPQESIVYFYTEIAIDTLGDWAFSGSSITSSPTVTPPTVSGSSIIG